MVWVECASPQGHDNRGRKLYFSFTTDMMDAKCSAFRKITRYFTYLFKKVTFLLNVGRTGYWRPYHNIACWTSVMICIHLRRYFCSHSSVFPCRGCVNSPDYFSYFWTRSVAYVQLKNGVLQENMCVTTLSLLFLCSGYPIYSRQAYVSSEKCWRTMWLRM